MAHNWKTVSPFTQIGNAQFTMLGHLMPSEPLDFSAAPVAPPSPNCTPLNASPVLDLSVASKGSPPPPSSDEGSTSPAWERDSPEAMTHMTTLNMMLKRKAGATNSRPFKAYPRFPSSSPVGMIGGQLEQMLNRESFQTFESFRSQMLAKMGKDKGSGRANRPSRADEAGSPQHPSSTDTDFANMNGKDAAYLERRRKNNEAAKRSRDNRRNKEDELAIWATYLERENLILKSTLAQGGICMKCQNVGSNSN